jgi:tetratricopeptide (TPR) repeat protein
MKPESIVLGVAGTFFGLLVGWVIGTQQTGPSRAATAPAVAARQTAGSQADASEPASQAPRVLDEAQAQALRATAEKNPTDAAVRVDLGNLYFDAERYPEAVAWYQEALKLNPNSPDVSTDLGVAFYYMNQPDQALQQFADSLKADPKHAKTLLNQGIVLAFGKQDLKGAAASWERLIQVAPTSPEADVARKALDGLRSAHPDMGASPSTAPPGK